ncbi:unnamed protein product [Arabidopsis halleri]
MSLLHTLLRFVYKELAVCRIRLLVFLYISYMGSCSSPLGGGIQQPLHLLMHFIGESQAITEMLIHNQEKIADPKHRANLCTCLMEEMVCHLLVEE